MYGLKMLKVRRSVMGETSRLSDHTVGFILTLATGYKSNSENMLVDVLTIKQFQRTEKAIPTMDASNQKTCENFNKS